MESRQPLILLTCSDTATFPWVWSYLGIAFAPSFECMFESCLTNRDFRASLD
jgi:hypothetical protein